MKPYTHPGKPELVMARYRRHILGCKKKWGTARSLIHYRALLDEYLAAKRVVISNPPENYLKGMLAFNVGKGFLDNPYIDFSTNAIPKEYSTAARLWIDGYVKSLVNFGIDS